MCDATEIFQVVASFGLLSVGVWGARIAKQQLESLAKSAKKSVTANELSARANQNANIMAVLSLESAIATARYHLTEAAARMATLDSNPDPTAIEFAEAMYNAASEQYLNVTDRLCASIVRGQVDEEVYRRDYRLWLAEIVKKFSDRLGAGTRHPNIVRVHEAWSDDRKAVDSSIKPPS